MGGFMRIATPAVMLFAIALAAVPLGLTVNLAGADPHVPFPVHTERAARQPDVPLMHLRSPVLTDPSDSRAVAAAPARTYTVAQGDTLWVISREAGVSVAALAEANQIADDDVLHPGQILRLPPPGTGASAHAVAMLVRPRLRWPLYGRITSGFGWRWIFYHREFHSGIDIAGQYGAPVLAARDGRVRFAAWMEGYGNRVVVDHGHGIATTYSHLEEILVRPGQRVQEGELIGKIGSTGESTGPHLHFEVLRNQVPMNPTPYLP